MSREHDIVMDIKMKQNCFPDIEKLAAGQPADENQILHLLDFIGKRYDCSDFRMVCILRALFCYQGLISPPTLEKMKRCVLSFKYWMDEPGVDSMCYWSENHQLLFATCEYLAGQLYPDEIFINDGRSGKHHSAKAKERLDIWFETRFALGFVEWHSNTYYEEDIAPLSLLIDCSKDALLAQKATLLLDLLLLDLALHSYRGFFCATSGRCYEEQKKDPKRQDVLDIMKKAFGLGGKERYDYTRLSADFVLNHSYRVPPVLREIAHDQASVEIRDSMGLSLAEVAGRFPDHGDMLRRGMYLWSMEAFTNPESAGQTLDIFRAWNLRENDFLKDIRLMDIPVLRRLGLIPALVRALNPVTQGIAIQRANSYTYKTADYMLSTAQQYHPGEFGDQQHIWQATLGKGVTVFTTHPGAAFFDDNARNFSPSRWVGNGILPHAQQHRNVSMCLYDLRVRRGLLEKKRLWLSHAWFPADAFDDCTPCGPNLICGRSEQGYIALFSLHPMERQGADELIQRGKVTAWAAIVGNAESHGDYAAFVRQAKASALSLKGRALRLAWGKSDYELMYRQGFWVNGQEQESNYPRLACPYGNAPREPKEYAIAHNGHSLRLRWDGLIREVDGR